MKKLIITIKRKWAEYLLEVIVIVGSILGAFALEQWGEERENLKEELILLKGLHNELVENKNRLVKSIERKERGIYYYDILLNQFSFEKYTISNDSVRKAINRASYNSMFTYNPRYGFIKTIISSGKANLISNTDITKFITQFEDEVIDSQENLMRYRNNWDDYISGMIFKHIPILSGGKTYANITDKFENSYQTLFDDSLLFGHLKMSMNYVRNTINEQKVLLKKIKNVITLIEKDLKNKAQ